MSPTSPLLINSRIKEREDIYPIIYYLNQGTFGDVIIHLNSIMFIYQGALSEVWLSDKGMVRGIIHKNPIERISFNIRDAIDWFWGKKWYLREFYYNECCDNLVW